MKLLIDIPEQMYLNAKADTLCGTDILVSAIKNGIPQETVTEFADRCRECGREKVLDKIFDEVCDIDDDIVFYPDSLECKAYVRLIKVMEIIDKYRGESKDAGTN